MEKLINQFDKIVWWPKKLSYKDLVIKHLSTKFKYDKKYTEKEVNSIIDKFHLFEDISLLKRELVSKRMLFRKDDGSEYWKVK